MFLITLAAIVLAPCLFIVTIDVLLYWGNFFYILGILFLDDLIIVAFWFVLRKKKVSTISSTSKDDSTKVVSPSDQ
jgi:hypothetical protein